MIRVEPFPGDDEFWIVVPGIPKSLWSLPVGTSPMTIGRGKRCAIRLGDRSVSREHAVVWRDASQCFVRDLASANGTCVNGSRVSEAALRPGDFIQFGTLILRLVNHATDPDAAPLERLSVEPQTTLLTNNPGVMAVARLPIAAGGTGPVREDIGALYSLGGSLSLCTERDETLRHVVEWMREWAGSERSAVLAQESKAWRIAVTSVRNEPFAIGDIDWSTVERCLETSAPAQRRISGNGGGHAVSRAVAACPIVDSEPVEVVYGEWAREGAVIGNELFRAAVDVIGDTLSRFQPSRPTSNRRSVVGETSSQDTLIGGTSLDGIRAAIRQAASADATVLITGETGTGKELVAHAIHRLSRRAKGPFVARNCSAFPDSLLESELFGYEPGAFTGATKLRKGVFDQANRGTLLLDEIGDTPLPLQKKLLRVLEEHAFQRVGGEKMVHVDLRIIAATNRELADAVSQNEFRGDLFYRLQVLAIHLPPLRARIDDIGLLARHFVQIACERMNRPAARITDDAVAKLESHTWPGNIRELRNTIDRAVIFSQGATVEGHHIVLTQGPKPSAPEQAAVRLDDVELQHIRQVIAQVGGNKARAARILGIDRTTLHRKLRRLGITTDDADSA